jgi:hypothetical protein
MQGERAMEQAVREKTIQRGKKAAIIVPFSLILLFGVGAFIRDYSLANQGILTQATVVGRGTWPGVTCTSLYIGDSVELQFTDTQGMSHIVTRCRDDGPFLSASLGDQFALRYLPDHPSRITLQMDSNNDLIRDEALIITPGLIIGIVVVGVPLVQLLRRRMLLKI